MISREQIFLSGSWIKRKERKKLLIIILVILAAFIVHMIFILLRHMKRDNHINQNIIFHSGAVVGTSEMGKDIDMLYVTNDDTATLIKGGPRPSVTSSLAQIPVRLYDYQNQRHYDYMLKDQVIIGRYCKGNMAQVQIDDSMVSVKHCKIYRQGEKIYIQDMGSTNHTYLNNCLVETATPLLYGDIIKLGRNMFQFQYFS